MRNTFTAFLLVAIIALAGCAGSDMYLGEWKATSTSGDKYTIAFAPKTVTIKRANGDTLHLEYTQNQVKIDNGVRTYGIRLSNGRSYNIFFPFANDKSKCLITVEDDKPLYVLSRTAYLSLDEFNKLGK